MDIFAHAFWTNAVFYKKYAAEKAQRYWAIFFGVMPDLISFTPAQIYFFLNRVTFNPALFETNANWTLRYAVASYNVSHSFITFLVVLLIVTAARKGKIYWPLWGWALHIGVDVFSHKGFFETPLLYPLSGFKFHHGISWAHPEFMLINYSALAAVYLFWFFVLRKKYAQN